MMKLKLLMLAKDQSSLGGVVNFVNILEHHLDEEISVERFQIGQKKIQSGRLLRIFIPFFDMMRLAFKVIQNRYDVIHINPSLNGRSLARDALFLLVIRIRGINSVLVFMHGWDGKTASVIGSSPLLKWVFRSLFGSAQAICVLANQFKQSLVEWGIEAGRIHVVTTMFDGQQFNGVTRKRADNEVRLLFLSRFIKEKGIYELLASFAGMHQRFPELRLILAGDGPEMSTMQGWVHKAGLQNHVSFTGYVRNEEKAQVLMNADVFVLPSYSEGCPVSLLEAMAAGLPVVASDVGGVSNVIVPGKNGYLLDEVTPEKIEAAVRNLLGDSDERVRMAEYNRKIAWECYEASVVSGNLGKTYRRLAHQG